jgi:hypothetical protein
MQRPIALSGFLWVICAAAAVGLASRSGSLLAEHHWPRSLWPLLIPCYLAWIGLDCIRALCPGLGSRLNTAPRLRAWVGPSVVLVALAITGGFEEAYRRWADFRSHARSHYLQEALCRSSARGERGELILEYPYGCQVGTIPEANGPAERAQMLEAAERHARLRRYWESRW